MSEEAVLRLKGVTKKIGTRTIVDQLTFDVRKGEVFGFLGPNGAGKTTTIRMIVGLISMTKGEILIKDISVRKHFELAMTHIGAIVENPEMYKFLSGYQNLVMFARRHAGVTKERIQEVIELVGLQNRIHDKVKRYSLGMRQRLGVAQALLHKPSVLIFDEPTNGLDPAGIRELRDYLRKLAKEENIAVVVSSHLLSEMELMCDRIAIIQSGKLIDVRSIADSNAINSEAAYLFEVAEPAAALERMAELMPDVSTTLHEDGLLIHTAKERVPEIIRSLIFAQIDIYGVLKQKSTLEDQFLELTRGEMIV